MKQVYGIKRWTYPSYEIVIAFARREAAERVCRALGADPDRHVVALPIADLGGVAVDTVEAALDDCEGGADAD